MTFLSHKKINMLGARRSNLDQAKSRLVLLSVFFVLAYAIVIARAADLSLIQGALSYGEKDSFVGQSAGLNDENIRADIVDRNGVLLARSLKTASLFADAAMVQNPKESARALVRIFPSISYGSLLQKLQSKKRFVWIKRNISPQEQEEILQLGEPALNFKQEMRRVYPQGALTAHMVGASGVDGQGLSGVEASFDSHLVEQSDPLVLTLDVRLQHVLRREIKKSIDKFSAMAGAGIVMDVENGEILAAVSLPDFDPHFYQDAKNQEIFNRVTLGAYELGSTFKIFSTAAMLEKNNANMAQKFDARESLEVGRFKIRDYHAEDRVLTLPEVFIHSSNIGSAMMGKEVGTKRLKDFYRDIGLFDVPDFEINEMGKPIVPRPWREVNTLTASYGHGIAVSPLQLMKATASIMNGGVLVNPTLVKNTAKIELNKNKFETHLRIVSPQTSHRMRQLMRLVVTEGTGGNADVDGYVVGGKTGTAEKPGRGGYDRDKLISSFLGVFPMNKPRYAIFVMVDEPKGTKETYGYATGGWVGAPAVKNIVAGMASILGLQPHKTGERFEGSLVRYVKTKEEIKQEKRSQNIAAH